MSLRSAFAGLLVALLAGCTTSAAVNATANFDRPVDVDFLCLNVANTAQSTVIPLTALNCQLSNVDNGAEGNGTTGNLNNHLHAVVTQFDRGELAVVNLANISGVSLVDNIPAVPGVTFIPVGNLPTAVVADTWTGTSNNRTPMIWVANSQDNNLTQLNALFLRQPLILDGSPGAHTPFVRNLPLRGSPRDLAVDTVTFSGVTRRLLYIALPDQGAIQVYDVTDPTNPMDEGLSTVTAPVTADAGTDGGLDAGMATVTGHPVGLALAPESDLTLYPLTAFAHLLYVADDQNPWIHVLSPTSTGTGLEEVNRFYVGVPTRSAVRVPQVRQNPACGDAGASDPDHCAPDRYLYMISAVDGAVYAWDIDRRTLVHANVLPGYVPQTDAGTDGSVDSGTDASPDAAADSGDGSTETDASNDATDVTDVTDVSDVTSDVATADACVVVVDGGPTEAREFDPTAPDLYRLYLPSPAASLTPIVTQDYFNYGALGTATNYPCNAAATNCPTAQGAAPGELHGVFLGVALRDGNFTVVNIDDYDYECRIHDCNAAAITESCFFREARHYPRAALSFTAAPRVNSAPVLTASSLDTPLSPTIVRSGVPAELSIPRIACYPQRTLADEACTPAPTTSTATNASGMIVPTVGTPVANGLFNFGITLAPRTDAFCAGQSDADVFTVRNEAWTLTYEGTLPGLDIGGGQFLVTGGGNLLSVSVPGGNFCNRGAIGDNQEVLTIVDDPPPAAVLASNGVNAALCQAVFGGGNAPIQRDFMVGSASQSVLQLTIAPQPTPAAGVHLPPAVTPTLVTQCYPQATHFQVRAANQWIVVGTRAGYLHSVVPGPNGVCVVNPQLQAASDQRARDCIAYLSAHDNNECFYPSAFTSCPEGRVCTGNLVGSEFTSATSPVFANQYFCLQIYPGIARNTDATMGAPLYVPSSVRDLQYAFAITGAYEPMIFSTGLLPSAVQFVSVVGRLYVVDTGQNSLVEYRIDPLTRTRLFN